MLHYEDAAGVNPSPYTVATDGEGRPATATDDADFVGEKDREEEEEEEEGEGHWLDGDGSDKLPDTAPGEKRKKGRMREVRALNL